MAVSITEEVSFDKGGNVERFPIFRKLFLAIIIILVATLSFALGRISNIDKNRPIKIDYDTGLYSQSAGVINAINKDKSGQTNGFEIVASKNGTKYHYSYCSSAKQIKEENKIVFNSVEDAESSGYTLAGNCKPR